MRWAVFSNVHANLPALQAVLSALGKKRVRQIYCLGDLVGCGPFPAETLESLRASKVVCIRGSADTRVLAARRKTKNNRLENWTLKRLTAQDITFLRALPARVQLRVHGKAVLMVHGSRCPDGEYVPDSSEKDDLKETLARNDSQVLISGGSREPFVRNLKNGWVINCGCLGRNSNSAGIAHYALVSITDSGVRVTMQKALYSREALLRAAVRRDFPREPSSIVRPTIEEEGSTELLMQGVTAALRSLERAFSRTLQAVMKQQNPENVRDLRIGASRLLLALMMFSPPRKQRYFVKALKHLRKAAGDLRELDILLQHVVAAGPELQPTHAGGLAGFLDELASQREIAKNSLTAELKHKRTARLVNVLNKQIRCGFWVPGQDPNGNAATQDIRADFHRIIKKIALRAAADLERTHNVLQQAEFHDLRITSKKLRYTLEVFQKVTGSDYSAEVGALRDFQKLMGGIHDFDTSTELLATLQHRLRRKLAPQDLRAADFLAFVFQKQRVTMFGRFLEVSHDFAASRFFNSLIPDRPHI